MAHWAELDADNVVIRVLVGDNNDPAGDEGYFWIQENLGGNWVKTSYNGKIRKNFAGVGFFYDEILDAFIPPKPFKSWTLNKKTAQWKAPVAKPADGLIYFWNEELVDWELANFSEVEE
jgi:hypothetical protein